MNMVVCCSLASWTLLVLIAMLCLAQIAESMPTDSAGTSDFQVEPRSKTCRCRVKTSREGRYGESEENLNNGRMMWDNGAVTYSAAERLQQMQEADQWLMSLQPTRPPAT